MVADLDVLGAEADRRRAEIEDLRRLPDDLATGLVDTGLCRALAPAELGAPELPIPDLAPLVERLAWHEAGLGWNAMIAATTSLAAGYLPAEAAEAIYGPPDAWTGGFAAPRGKATPSDDGGLTVSGRWAWGSGTHHCTFIGGGTRLVDRDGNPAPRADGLAAPFVFFAADEVELLDTWHALGIRGSGSTDYCVEAAHVPEGRWFELGRPPVIDRALYRFPFFGALAVGVASVALGIAGRALEELATLAPGRRPAGSSRSLAERPTAQAAFATATADLRSARLLLGDAAAAAWRAAEHGRPDAGARIDLRLAATNAARRAAGVVDACYDLAGGDAVYDHSVMQKLFRDVHVATQHAMVAPRTFEFVGRSGFGLDVDLGQI